ncbi:MAG: NAD(P)H-dependent amine dehydrogenase family protein [Neobacillus sp.]
MDKALKDFELVVYGLGPIGMEILKKCEEHLRGKVIGAVDIDPAKIGKDIGELTGLEKRSIRVVSSIKEIEVKGNHPRIVIHATGSNLQTVWPQIKELVENGYSVVSTCEQLSYPWHRYPELSKEIDCYATEKGVTVIGTGVNPGYVMDTLVLSLTSVLSDILSIRVTRRVDVKKRRLPLQKKVGVGMAVEEFNNLAAEGKIGHVGLEESLRLLAAGLNFELESVENSINPKVTDQPLSLPHFDVKAGEVIGLHQVSRGSTKDGRNIELDLVMATSVNESEDAIEIDGDMKQRLVVPGGIFGDSATASIIINTAKTVALEVKPGLHTMKDIRLTRSIHL